MGRQRLSLAKVMSELFWAPGRILSIIPTRQFIRENAIDIQETIMAHEDPC